VRKVFEIYLTDSLSFFLGVAAFVGDFGNPFVAVLEKKENVIELEAALDIPASDAECGT
jgi:hypothetical protein